MPRLAPRVKYHRNGTCTVSGIPLQDLKSMLNCAWLDLDASEKRAKERRGESPEGAAWFRRMLSITSILLQEVDQRIRDTYPWNNRPRTKEHRLQKVTSDRKGRLFIDGLVASIQKKRAINTEL